VCPRLSCRHNLGGLFIEAGEEPQPGVYRDSRAPDRPPAADQHLGLLTLPRPRRHRILPALGRDPPVEHEPQRAAPSHAPVIGLLHGPGADLRHLTRFRRAKRIVCAWRSGKPAFHARSNRNKLPGMHFAPVWQRAGSRPSGPSRDHPVSGAVAPQNSHQSLSSCAGACLPRHQGAPARARTGERSERRGQHAQRQMRTGALRSMSCVPRACGAPCRRRYGLCLIWHNP
jgi:hypothetical protein